MATHANWGTPSNVVDAILKTALADGDDKNTIFVDPSAGNGAFVMGLLRRFESPRIIAFEHHEGRYDWLSSSVITAKRRHSALLSEARGMPRVQCLAQQYGRARASDIRNKFLNKRIITLGNPPYNGDAALRFVSAAKRYSDEVLMLLPAGLLEPCRNRGTFVVGLHTVYPVYCRKFEDLEGRQFGSGSRPVFVYKWRRDYIGKEATISFAIHRALGGDKDGKQVWKARKGIKA